MSYEDFPVPLPDIALVTVYDKINSYMVALRLSSGKTGHELFEASQWQAIGNKYREIGELRLAVAAYKSSLIAVQRAAPESPSFTLSDSWEQQGELRDLIKVVENSIPR